MDLPVKNKAVIKQLMEKLSPHYAESLRAGLVEALSLAPPLRKRIFKKKLIKNKVSFVEIENFIKTFAPKYYEKLR